MNFTNEIQQYWGWCGIRPDEVIGENDFGNLIVKDEGGRYWRLRPEDCYCQVIAENRAELDRLSQDQEFLHDWYMRELVAVAASALGPLSEGRKYCLKIPSILGGAYGGDNLAIAPLVDLVRAPGDVARQIKDLADGAQVKIKVSE